MCTAVAWENGGFYFGRNLDLEYSYKESIVVMPRCFPLKFRCGGELRKHYAMIGMAFVQNGYPLFYEGTNDAGLSMAGLNFPGNADYKPEADGKDNIAPFELIPWVLSQCETVAQARVLLARINLADIPFSETLPLSPLHWIVADRGGSLTVESMKDGLMVHENSVGVLTNNPPFPWHMQNLSNYMMVSRRPPENLFSDKTKLARYSLGMGGIGLPGDLSSASRFVRAAFVKLNSEAEQTEAASVRQMFHILGSVAMPRGCVEVRVGEYEITRYTSCCSADTGVYYYTTYENGSVTAVDMHRENLDGEQLAVYPMRTEMKTDCQNE